MPPSPDTHDNRRLAKFLYWQGWRVTAIAEYLHEKRPTVEAWKQRDGWAKAPAIERVEGAIEHRLVQLVTKDQKTGADYKEIDLLGRQIERLARVRRYESGGNEADLNPRIAERSRGRPRQATKNEFSAEQAQKLRTAFLDALFGYQSVWYQNADQRTRAILKSRQIGATWYFAREALLDAVETGRNQIFLSASKAQAHVFKQYIIAFAREAADVDLKGDPIVLGNGATLYFLGTNARTAQGYHGNFYFDEFFWTPRFAELNKVASAMALHKKWRKTYFSTPSAISHEAYPFWNGDQFNERRPKSQQILIPTTHQVLQPGLLCGDRIWRQIVTIEDAERGGCDLFDIDELRNFEYSPDQFDNLLMCNFIDDTKSVFPFALLQRCMVDSWEEWDDYRPHAQRPFGDREVWLGYDPNGGGDDGGVNDSGACVLVAPPAVRGGKFRVLERHQFRGMDYQAQAESIQRIAARFNVGHMGIDVTGVGQGVYQIVRQFYPGAVPISYSVEVKTRMVLKAQNVMGNGRLEFDSGWIEMAQAFMAIRKVLTPSGRQATYSAGRSRAVGHADIAWATMHALDHEPLEGATESSTTIMEFS